MWGAMRQVPAPGRGLERPRQRCRPKRDGHPLRKPRRRARTRGDGRILRHQRRRAPTPRQVLPGRRAVRHRGRGLVRQRKPGVGDDEVRQVGRIRVPHVHGRAGAVRQEPGRALGKLRRSPCGAEHAGRERNRAQGVRRRRGEDRRGYGVEGDARVLAVSPARPGVSSDAEGGGAQGRLGLRERRARRSMSSVRRRESRRPGRARGRVLSPVRRHSRIP
mmetsp:Transcript_10919/g.45494  ORF Transcript_10919/g.45494 Transcript_10919/m.45494 type:complete len:219 (-) Transcript_10919:491-1147(-)